MSNQSRYDYRKDIEELGDIIRYIPGLLADGLECPSISRAIDRWEARCKERYDNHVEEME